MPPVFQIILNKKYFKLFAFRVIGNASRGDARQILASVGSDEKESRILYVGNLIAAFLFI